MRIHRLTLRGIGPFKNEQTVDVDEVGQQGLFLLDGPTGVGKSTVVDAIVFALFGSPATEQGVERMVSDFLGEDIAKGGRPYVELTFSVPTGTFRVHREPAAPYTNRNGKADRHNATAQLWRLANEAAGDGEMVANKPEEVGREIADLLGLNRGQVLSTIVLAQGEFATFLRAKSDERRAILQSVFKTERYERLQTVLVRARKDAYGRRNEALQAMTTAVAVLDGAAGLGVDPEVFTQEYRRDPEAGQALVDRRVEELGLVAQRLEAELAALETWRADAAASLARATERSKGVELKRALLEKRRELDAVAAEITALDSQVADAREARTVGVAFDAWRAKGPAADAARRRAEDLLHSLPDAERDMSAAELDALLAGVIEDKAALQAFLAVEAGLDGQGARLKLLVDEVETLRRAIDGDEEVLRELPARLTALTGECETLAPVASGLEAARLQVEIAEKDVRTLMLVEGLREEVQELSRNAEKAGELATAAAGVLDAARAKYQDGLAAELAQTLIDDQPCPVCGSQEHPMPARPAVDHVSADRLAVLEDERQALSDLAVEARQRVAAASAALQTRGAQLGGRDHEAVNQAQHRAKLSFAEAEDAQCRLTVAQKSITVLLAQQRELAERVAAHKEDLAKASEKHRNLAEWLAEETGRVNRARLGFDSVAARDRHLAARKRVLEDVKSARARQETAAAAAADAHRAYTGALHDSRFAGEAEFLAAVRAPEWIENSAALVKEHWEDVAAVKGQLESEQLRDVDETETFDLAALEAAADRAKAAADACRGDHVKALDVHAKAKLHGGAVRARWSDYSEVERGTRPVIRIANLVTAEKENLHKIPLANYVVMRRFADVVDAANTHLADMSDGRYRLATTGGAAGRELKIGLGLEVFDDRTDAPRGPGTLSGGETFYVSLALALGLADVVQSESGGVSLETLFVDEGFGSLDAETLDSVMNVLTRLGRGQRTVGLISHVEELKRRIPDRVEIHRPDPNGPSEIKPCL